MAIMGGEARLPLAFPVEKIQQNFRKLVRQDRVEQRIRRELIGDIADQKTAWAEGTQYMKVHCARVSNVLRDAARDRQICRGQSAGLGNVTADHLIVGAWWRTVEFFL